MILNLLFIAGLVVLMLSVFRLGLSILIAGRDGSWVASATACFAIGLLLAVALFEILKGGC